MNDEFLAYQYLRNIHYLEIRLRSLSLWVESLRDIATTGKPISYDEVESIKQAVAELTLLIRDHNLTSFTYDPVDTDEYMKGCIELAINSRTISISMIQRALCCGYGKARHILDRLEALGIVGKAQGEKARVVLYSP